MDAVSRIRGFNRTWSEVLGLLDQGLLATEHSLAEARVIFELAQRPRWERQELRDRLGMDASYLTRVVGRLESDGLVEAHPSEQDGRAVVLGLTDQGRRSFELLDGRSAAQIETLIEPLSGGQRSQLSEAMTVITQLVQPGSTDRQVEFRSLRPGDMGWVIERHGAVYADEFGWNSDFEGLVAQIVADFHAEFKPGREQAWIAEVDGARAGCVFCRQRDEDTAQLRILLVEPWARGLQLGRRLVERSIEFATEAGYSKMTLWTNDVLVAARRIYQTVGFELVDEEPHHSFGHDLVGQNWELSLVRSQPASP